MMSSNCHYETREGQAEEIAEQGGWDEYGVTWNGDGSLGIHLQSKPWPASQSSDYVLSCMKM
jgi:hypothetical protein